MAEFKYKKTHDEAIALLADMAELMALAGENQFKVRAFEKASDSLASVRDLGDRASEGTLTDLPGVGKGIAEVLTEYLLKGKATARDELLKSLPAGLMELVRVPGLGPKKARFLIDELGITTLGELEYACSENRLVKLKGFGDKLQHKILEGIKFLKSAAGKARLVDALPVSGEILKVLKKSIGPAQVSETGVLRRRLEVLDSLDYLVELPSGQEKQTEKKAREALEAFKEKNPETLPIELHFAPSEKFGTVLAQTTGSTEHVKALGAKLTGATEEAAYKSAGLPWIAPEMRETGEEIKLAKAGKLEQVLKPDAIRGVFHNHTNRSDGNATLEEMVIKARDLGYEYFGISDHSQSAFYANGLKKDAILEQEKEVRKLQDKYPEIKIFWGIESDILKDGELDYDPALLKRFDFVVASIHSRFQMDKAQMTERILKAVRNPYTRFVGHITGRLLLGREGYEIDMEKIIREAAKHDVAIEINANPARLDIDWRWGAALRTAQTKVSVNPDAHAVEGLEDTSFGVTVARKALLTGDLVLNSWDVKKVESWLKRR